MSKRLTYKFVKESFEKEGYTLLSKEYRNNSQKLEYVCSEGHHHKVSWGDWKRGNRCYYCHGNIKPTIEFIRSEFEKEGFTLLTNKYINNRKKLDYICPNGHIHNTTWKGWYIGNRCPYCSGKIKKTIEFLKSEFEKERYTLLTTEYVNAFQKLDYICPIGHKYSISWGNWNFGYRCPECAGQLSPTIEFIKEKFAEEGYILHTTVYINNKVKLKYTCPKGHDHSTSWIHWIHGKRCKFCAILNKIGPKR